MALTNDNENFKDKLIRSVKKEVKQIMEEAVTRKFVHEESSSVTSLCGAVEACLSQGLRRRALGLFKTSSTTALLHKAGKSFDPAAVISRKVQEIENTDPNRRSSSSGDSTSRPPKPPLQKKNSSGNVSGPRYLWIRLALFDKHLARIIDHLVQNSCKYYEKDALVADPDYGSILSSLLVGPCALDYSKTKTQDHFWTDPPADELVQRHRISSGHSTPPTCRRPALNYRRSLHAGSSEESHRSLPVSAKDYVESLHQNSRATLLYGKNNVLVLPKDLTEPMQGYLSLHQTAQSLTIKWTPNQLMNGYSEAEVQDKSAYWDYAMNVRVDEIVYVHCHQSESGGTVVLVGQDGVQRPPIHFPRGGHLLAFLSCLETGLLPHGQLDPPLWSQRGKGKVFPKLRRKGRAPVTIRNDESEEESTDYVFRIVSKARHEDYLAGQELMDPGPFHAQLGSFQQLQSRVRAQLASTSTASSTSSSKSLSLDPGSGSDIPDSPKPPPEDIAKNTVTKSTAKSTATLNGHKQLSSGESIQLVCDTMKRQIISRAFYGWLAYCRHLSTVRTHLSGLVHPAIIAGVGAHEGLTKERWAAMHIDGVVADREEVFRLTYFGGVCHEIRKETWPYLLGHHLFGSTPEERSERDARTRQDYETTMSEWLAVEAIVRQKDKEAMAANLAKLSSESVSAEHAPAKATLARDLSNDVFEDNISIASDDDQIAEEDENEERCPPNSLEHTQADLEVQQNLDNHRQDLKVTCSVGPGLQCPPNSVDDGDQGRIVDGVREGEDEPRVASASSDEGVVADEEAGHHTDLGVALQSTVIVTTNPSLDSGNPADQFTDDADEKECAMLTVAEDNGEANAGGNRSNCISPASSQGGVYSTELLETFGLNIHRIDKDVQRCDRNYCYFTTENLEKLRNIMCTYVWEHLDIGYMQGMCDLVAPLLVVLDDEGTTYSCFCQLMERMGANFPNGGAMDNHFANLRSLIQILDGEMYELMHQNGDYTHFYFCYRWFLLDFKRELLYDDVFSTWETIWAAKHVASSHFVLFIALALVETYREIILNNSMDFTDIIKFFNEMAERHEAKAILKLSRELVLQLQTLIENK